MIEFFEWIIGLSLTMKIIVFSTVLVMLIIIPYSEELKRIILIILKKDKFKIISFELKFLYDYEVGQTSENKPVFRNSKQPNYTTSGNHIIISWNISGLLYAKSSIYQKRIHGNQLIIPADSSKKKFSIKFQGIFSQKLFSINLSDLTILEMNNLRSFALNNYSKNSMTNVNFNRSKILKIKEFSKLNNFKVYKPQNKLDDSFYFKRKKRFSFSTSKYQKF